MTQTNENQRGYQAAKAHHNDPSWAPSKPEGIQFWEGYAEFMREDAFFAPPGGSNDSLSC